jgi:beta-lactamase regulating signal transducer with metallopeptidase domain
MELLFQSGEFNFLVEFFTKSSLILGLTLLILLLLRKQSASLRHLILVTALLGLLVLPFLMAFAPGWRTGLLPSSWGKSIERSGSTGELTLSQAFYPTKETPRAAAAGTPPYRVDEGEAREEKRNVFSYFPAALWTAGMIFLLLKLILGLYGTARLTRRGVSLQGYPWRQLFLLFLSKTPLRKTVRLLRNNRVMVPMTWGVVNPVIVMPAESGKWPLDQCSSVLFHELSHVKRGDFIVRLLARISCSFYWFNPLCWVVYRKLKREQEKACDEMVLKAGIKPSTYAAHLLQMRKSIDKRHGLPCPALGMAGRSEFKERLLSILKKQLYLKEVKMRVKITLFIIGVLAVALIGTARPSQSQGTLYPDSEDAALVQSSETPETPETAAVSEVTADVEEKAKEEKKEQEAEAGKEKEKKKEKARVRVKIEEKDKSGKKVVEKEVVIIPGGADFHIEELKLVKGRVIVSEDGEIYMLSGDKGKVKKVKVERGKVLIGEKGEPITIIVHPKIKDKIKENVIEIISDSIEITPGKIIEAKGGNVVLIGKKDGEKWIYEIKERACKSGEKEKDEEKEKEGERHIVIEAEEGDIKEDLIEIGEGDRKIIKIKEIKVGERNVVVIKKGVNEGKGMYGEFISTGKLAEKQAGALKEAVSKLQKELPACFSVKSEIGEKLQKVTIDCSVEEPTREDIDRALKVIKVFEKEFEEILGEKEGKKD